MPLPQVNERIKEVPAQALRAVFAGIGQVLLVADKIRNRTAEQASAPAPATAAPAEAPSTAPAAAPSAESAEPTKTDSSRWRSLDETGNVRLFSEADQAAAAAASPAPDAAAPPAEAPPAEAPPAEATLPATDAAVAPPVETPAAEVPPTPQAPAAPEPAQSGGLPLSNYDELTIPSLRARMRVLSAAQVTALLDYEKATQARAAVITMFERRLAKLEQDDS
jgi:hypothetical protein